MVATAVGGRYLGRRRRAESSRGETGEIHSELLGRFVTFLTLRADSGGMRVHKGRAVAAGLLCAIAATVAVWSGPLFAASSALHGSGQAQVHTSVTGHTDH
jgi:hypothetical protein